MTDPFRKILPLDEVAAACEIHRRDGKRIVQCHGVFDLLHPGHIRHFQEARRQGDVLVVTVTEDRHVNKGPGRPVFPAPLRAEQLASLAQVDYVALSPYPRATECIHRLKPDVYVKGQDYEKREGDVTGGIREEEAAVEACGGRIHFTHDLTFSSSALLNRWAGVFSDEARRFLEAARGRLDPDRVAEAVESLKDLRVLLIGDAIVDEYHYCQPLGKSPKETIVSTRFLNAESFPGGILACANHVAAFSGHVSLVTVLGAQDSKGALVEGQLDPSVRRKFFYRPDAPTIVKRRYVEPAFLTKMFQIAYLNDTDLPDPVAEAVEGHLKEVVGDFDVVIVADYGHGLLTPRLRNVLTERAPFLALNVQTNSANLGFNPVTKYARADYLCIDEPELRLALQQKYGPVETLVGELAGRYPGAAVTVTRGHRGSITRTAAGEEVAVPTFSRKVVDRVGAGDAYFALTSLLAVRHADPHLLGFTGNAAGAMAVEVVCNRSSLESVPLLKFIKALLA